MGDEKKRSETAMGEPASVREETARNADEVAMGRSIALKDLEARSDAQIPHTEARQSVGYEGSGVVLFKGRFRVRVQDGAARQPSPPAAPRSAR
jgi:hypothetical protein